MKSAMKFLGLPLLLNFTFNLDNTYLGVMPCIRSSKLHVYFRWIR